MVIFTKIFVAFFGLVFSLIWPLFKNPVLATYIGVFSLSSVAAYANYRWIKRHKAYQQKGTGALKYYLLVAAEVFLVLFIFWLLLVHFHTYRSIKL
ncbi:hypothetical protein HOH87_06575 [bacterium]|nr:hypothetical protein [bacterium]